MEFKIRPIQVEDAKGMNVLRRMPGVHENILGIPSERIADSEKFIQNIGPNEHHFVAVTNNGCGEEIVIGAVGITVLSRFRSRHAASLGIMVHKDYQNQGVGRALMKTVIDLADQWLMLVRIELTVFIDNERAIHLYESFGFEKEGVRRCSGIRNGEFTDDLLMARINSKFLSISHK